MSAFTLDDLSALGTPEILETLDYEALFDRRKLDLVARAPSYGFNYNVQDLETDPAMIILQEASYEELVLRARGNDIARARYLYYARGNEVDHLGAFYDVLRLAGETDARFKGRIILAIQGRSTGGTAPRYRYVAMSSSLRVEDAYVYTEGVSPQVNIAVFSTDNNGVADAPLLTTVRAAVNADDVRMVNDILSVRAAVVQTVAVTAQIWLNPNASDSILTTLQTNIPNQWKAESGLGKDLTTSWLIAKMMVSGVHRVNITSPTADVIMQPFQAVRISSVTLTLMGRDF